MVSRGKKIKKLLLLKINVYSHGLTISAIDDHRNCVRSITDQFHVARDTLPKANLSQSLCAYYTNNFYWTLATTINISLLNSV